MELLLLEIVVLVRPLASMEYAEALFEILGMGLFGLLVGALLLRGALRQTLELSAVDFGIAAFSLWCVGVFVVYYDTAGVSALVKLLGPMLSYTFAKNVIRDRKAYTRVLVWMMVGFSVPTLASAAMIAARNPTAVDMVIYWTDVVRWKGVYTHSHNLGLSMTLFLITMVLFATLREGPQPKGSGRHKSLDAIFLASIGIVALWCLYMSEVRTAVLGLLVFVSVFGYLRNKKALLFGGIGLAVVAVLTATAWIPVLLHEFAPDRRGGELQLMQLGSGRLTFWTNDLGVFLELPLDQMLAGVGIGATTAESVNSPLFGHNDWIRLLTNTGLVGTLLFVFLQFLILRAILRMDGKERHAFLAMFVAANVMMAVSNSLVWRIQVSQLYYILLAFIEVKTGPAKMENPAMLATQKAS